MRRGPRRHRAGLTTLYVDHMIEMERRDYEYLVTTRHTTYLYTTRQRQSPTVLYSTVSRVSAVAVQPSTDVRRLDDSSSCELTIVS